MRRWPIARARRRPGELNRTEDAYRRDLEGRKLLGEVLEYWFEGLKLRLADNTFYTPDFFVLVASGELECHEVKGHWEDDARVKIKVAASLYPFRFLAVQPLPKRDGGGWKTEEF